MATTVTHPSSIRTTTSPRSKSGVRRGRGRTRGDRRTARAPENRAGRELARDSGWACGRLEGAGAAMRAGWREFRRGSEQNRGARREEQGPSSTTMAGTPACSNRAGHGQGDGHRVAEQEIEHMKMSVEQGAAAVAMGSSELG
jgi:hypothetical protein